MGLFAEVGEGIGQRGAHLDLVAAARQFAAHRVGRVFHHDGEAVGHRSPRLEPPREDVQRIGQTGGEGGHPPGPLEPQHQQQQSRRARHGHRDGLHKGQLQEQHEDRVKRQNRDADLGQNLTGGNRHARAGQRLVEAGQVAPHRIAGPGRAATPLTGLGGGRNGVGPVAGKCPRDTGAMRAAAAVAEDQGRQHQQGKRGRPRDQNKQFLRHGLSPPIAGQAHPRGRIRRRGWQSWGGSPRTRIRRALPGACCRDQCGSGRFPAT